MGKPAGVAVGVAVGIMLVLTAGLGTAARAQSAGRKAGQATTRATQEAGREARRERWQWPERSKNLEVLPEDFPADRLRSVMTGFSRSLGVRCNHCHVGEAGKPLSSYDFVSDDNPNKDRAREMLRMLDSINDHLAKITPTGPERVNVWCHTCHQGRPRPATLEEELSEAYAKGGAEAAIERYRELHERYRERGAYDFSERPLNALGYRLLGEGDGEGAIAVFRLATEEHPSSANAYDSLAEGYWKTGHAELAEVFYRKSLELDPDNRNAVEKLREIERGGETAAPAQSPDR